jgi:hypothetical protein
MVDLTAVEKVVWKAVKTDCSEVVQMVALTVDITVAQRAYLLVGMRADLKVGLSVVVKVDGKADVWVV